MANVDGTGPYLKKVVGKSDFNTVPMFSFGYDGPDGNDFEILMRLICQRWKSSTKQLLGKRQKAQRMTHYRNITGLRVMSKLVALPPGTPKRLLTSISQL